MVQALEKKPLYVQPGDAAQIAGVSRATVTNWCQLYDETKGAEGLKSHKVKGRGGRKGCRLIKISDLIAYIEHH